MKTGGDAYGNMLRRFCVELVEFCHSRLPTKWDLEIVARTRATIETSTTKRDLREMVSDFLEMAACFSQADVLELDERLKSLNLPSLTTMRSREHKRFREILSRGRIRGEDERRFVEGRLSDVGPTGPSAAERALANALLLASRP
jgi:hypothetical protein